MNHQHIRWDVVDDNCKQPATTAASTSASRAASNRRSNSTTADYNDEITFTSNELQQRRPHNHQQQQQQQQLLSIGQAKYTLTYTIKRGYFNLVRTLLALGADPNHIDLDDRDSLKRNSLIYTTFIRDPAWAQSVARLLLEYGADLAQTDSRRLTPIHYCCAFGRADLLSLFLHSLDFDLSRARDLNGNTCMHYAMRSRSLRCVQMLLAKYRSSQMAAWRVDAENVFGLRPSQVEETTTNANNNELLATMTTAATTTRTSRNNKPVDDSTLLVRACDQPNSNSSIVECRDELVNFLKISSHLKAQADKLALARANSLALSQQQIQKEAAVKSGIQRKRSKSSKKSDNIKNESQSEKTTPPNVEARRVSFSHLSKAIDKQGDEISIRIEPEPMSPAAVSLTASGQKKSPLGGVISSSNFNHVMSSKRSSSESVLSQAKSRKDVEESDHVTKTTTTTTQQQAGGSQLRRAQTARPLASSPTMPSPRPIDAHTARLLSQKSFLLDLREFLQNYIDYNGLFVGKEKMTIDVVSSVPRAGGVDNRPKTSLKQRVESCLKKRPQTALSGSICHPDASWKQSLPNIYYALECYMTPNYRETVRPPVSTKLKYSNMDFMEFKAKLKRNSLRMHRRSSSITTHTTSSSSGSGGGGSSASLGHTIAPETTTTTTRQQRDSGSTSSESGGDMIVASSSGVGLRRNSSMVSSAGRGLAGGKKKLSIDYSNTSPSSKSKETLAFV